MPGSVADAMAMAEVGLAYLARADLASVPADTQAECLRGLARAEGLHLVARSVTIRAFGASRGHEADGQYSPQAWLRWQTRVTKRASSLAVGWSRLLAAHPAVEEALAASQISVSWAQAVCQWSDRLPEAVRADADAILLAAAAGGHDLADLAALAEKMFRRCAEPDTDDGKGFDDRSLRLDLTFGGAGRLTGDLTPECAAAVQAVLDALGKKVGPEDERTQPQRHHDALEEACRRLAGGGMLPDRAGQPTQIQLHSTLGQFTTPPGGPAPGQTGGPAPGQTGGLGPGQPAGLGPGQAASTSGGQPNGSRLGDAGSTRLDQLRRAAPGLFGNPDPGQEGSPAQGLFTGAGGGPGETAAWAAGRAAADGQPGWIMDPVAAEAYACDAAITTIVTGHMDKVAVALAVREFLNAARGLPGGPGQCAVTGCDPPRCTSADHHYRPVPMTVSELQDLFLRLAIEMLSGPTGLAADLRSASGGPAACGVSLPLDVGAVTSTIPPHLRRAVITRDRHCAFPGCHQRPAACQVHHVIPRSQGGTTSLTNLVLLCAFHHLIAIHRWGWTLALNTDGTTTVTSPDEQRTFHSHAPPGAGHGPPLATVA